MGTQLRLLIIEDVEDHALLLVRELQKGGIPCDFLRVETVEELKGALQEGGWDAVISDFSLPGFNGIDALRIVQEHGLDLPFLLVSGAIGEEKAAEVMKAGAHDYIRKGNYARLVPTLERELRDARIRKERRQTAEELTRHREHLEELVEERTAELVKVNEALKAEKQEREQALLQLEAVLDNIREGVMISDLEGNVLTMNKEALLVSGFESVEQARQHLSRYLDYFEVLDLNGSEVPFPKWPVSRAIAGERFDDNEYLIRRKDVATPWIGSYSGAPVCNKEGDKCLAVVTFRDITGKKRSEEALRKSEAKFAKIFNSAPSVITITTLPEGRIIDVNDSALQTLGYSKEEMVGKTTGELGIWIDPSVRAGVVQAVQERGAVRSREVTLRARNGQTLVGLLAAEVIEIDEQRYMLSFVRDITERKKAEEEIARLNADLAARVSELEERNQELEAFNRMISHDLRQPLNNISLACQSVEMFCGNMEENCQQSVESALKSVQRMNTLIDTLLNFSRSTHGDLHRETFDISETARSVIAELRLAEPQRRVTFRVSDGIMANGDPKFLRAVLDNLIGNAWKYTGKREEGLIEFGATQREGRQVYFVRDNGRGFDTAEAHRIFIPFQRLSGADDFQGSGIGLATVERIIKRHGGRIWAEGEPDKGATFYFCLGVDNKEAVTGRS